MRAQHASQPDVESTPERAAKEVMAGRPQGAARKYLGIITVVAAILFAIDTFLVSQSRLLPFDLPVARFIQSTNWGPLVYLMEGINFLAGNIQIGFGVVVVIAVAVWDRRGGWLMALGGISSFLDNVIKMAMARQRPTADLVHILTPAPGYSYPSGHAVFFTWLSFMLAVSISPRLPARFRPIPWLLAAVVIVVTLMARVWAGDHWPSDVLGGFLFGLGWSALVLWVPERFLPSPSWSWIRRGRRSERATG